MQLFPEARMQEKHAQIFTSPVFAEALKYLEAQRQHYLATPMEPLPFHLFRSFFTEGDRLRYERLYFARRGRLTAFAMAVLLYGRDEDIEALEDAIWAICEEYTWVLPAHTVDLEDQYDRGIIDLFSAETGFALAEILSLIGDRLDSKIVRRIRECVEERIFTPYLKRRYHWETLEMNWAAVCSGSVGAAFMYLAPERFDLVKGRILDSMNCFLRGFGDDGVCLEGLGYWNYGFGFFVYYAQLLYEFTDGADNLFALPICRKIALFQQNAFMRQNLTISFSDGAQSHRMLPGLSQKLYDIYGEEILMPPLEYAEFDDNCRRFASYLRNIFWTDPNAPHGSARAGETYYPSAQWYLNHNEKLSLAAKAGHNDEPHNHNDIGSFLLMSDTGQILCDFGRGEYCRQYFRDETRYSFLCNSSRGHSVPIINGKYQSYGKEFCGNVLSHGGGQFRIEFAQAYEEADLAGLERTFLLKEDVFTLCDRFQWNTSGNVVQERFISLVEPTWDGKILWIGEYGFEGVLKAVCDDSFEGALVVAPKLSAETLKDHAGKDCTLYLIDFELTDPVEFELRSC